MLFTTGKFPVEIEGQIYQMEIYVVSGSYWCPSGIAWRLEIHGVVLDVTDESPGHVFPLSLESTAPNMKQARRMAWAKAQAIQSGEKEVIENIRQEVAEAKERRLKGDGY